MRSILCILLVFILAFPCFAAAENADAAAPETVQTADAALVSNPLPIDFTGGCPPLAEGYGEGWVYEDPTLRVSIEYKHNDKYIKGYSGYDMGYWVVDVHVGHASQLRTAAAESFSTTTTLPVESIAGRVNAVVAVNGDYFARHRDGFAVRQGSLIQNKLKGNRDLLLIDEDGDFHVFHMPEKGELSDTVDGKKVTNAFFFGPILVENGEARKNLPSFDFLKPDKYTARLAICQIGPLHYKLIVTTMEQDYTLGMRLKDFAQLCQEEGAQTAYNLDGGLSTTLFFNGQRLNEQNRVNFRNIPDIVYFASAWSGEGQ